MNIQPDFEELLRLLEEQHVEYMIVGGYAVAFHGYPRFTKDIDVFFNATEKNVSKLCRALIRFGFPESAVPSALFLQDGNIVNFGVPPVRVDFINQIDGVSYAKARKSIVRGHYGKLEVSF